MPLSSWERTYGWAWLLKLDEELFTWNDADGKRWHSYLQPLTQRSRYGQFLQNKLIESLVFILYCIWVSICLDYAELKRIQLLKRRSLNRLNGSI